MNQTAEQVLATVKYSGFVKSLYNRSGDISKDFSHAVLGLVTESREYLQATDKVNAIEEVGDLMFYLEALRQVLGDHAPINEDEVLKEYGEVLSAISGDVNLTDMHTEWLDLAKRWIGYGKAPTMTTSKLLAEATVLLTITIPAGILGDDDYDLDDVIRTNVRKLLKRYNGMTFSAELAVNRDLDAERSVLEGA
jgi:NTP pyrophosphatase (non-canonical NTP hydrolase)